MRNPHLKKIAPAMQVNATLADLIAGQRMHFIKPDN